MLKLVYHFPAPPSQYNIGIVQGEWKVSILPDGASQVTPTAATQAAVNQHVVVTATVEVVLAVVTRNSLGFLVCPLLLK